MGDEWFPAVLDTEEEHNFIKEGQRTFTNSAPYWIAGSTNSQPDDVIQYFNYSMDNSGI